MSLEITNSLIESFYTCIFIRQIRSYMYLIFKMANINILKSPRKTLDVIINHVQRRNMPVNVPPTATGKRRFRLPVETDPHKLVNYCCGLNYNIDQPPIELKSDNEYPDWLWKLRLGPKKNSWELEKGTKEYYLRLAEEGRDRNYRLKMTAPKPAKIVSKVIKTRLEYIHRLRFAALAHMEDDVGLEAGSMEKDWWSITRNPICAREYYLPVNENKVIYKDKIQGNTYLKNFHRDEDSTFKGPAYSIEKPPPIVRPAIQDSKRRHRYAST